MTRVNLPPGCMGFKAQDGTRYVARAGTSVDVADHHMAALRDQDYASAGLVDAGAEKFFIRESKVQGRWCKGCNKLWYAWRTVCPKCDLETVPEGEMDRPKMEEYIP